MTAAPEAPPRLLWPGEAAALAGVDTRTLQRWEQSGAIIPERSQGGHRRYRGEDIRALAVGGMRTGDAARRLHVHPRTLVNWANAGLIEFTRTPRGHRRYPVAAVEAIAAGREGTAS